MGQKKLTNSVIPEPASGILRLPKGSHGCSMQAPRLIPRVPRDLRPGCQACCPCTKPYSVANPWCCENTWQPPFYSFHPYTSTSTLSVPEPAAASAKIVSFVPGTS